MRDTLVMLRQVPQILRDEVAVDQLYHQVEQAGGVRWDTSSLINNLRLLD